MADKEAVGINFDDTRKNTIINFTHIETARRERFTILTLAEFKERYCEEEKPQPKFKKDDKVMIDGVINLALNHHVGSILELPNIDHPSTDCLRTSSNLQKALDCSLASGLWYKSLG